jgi:hypothetical protein
MAAGLGPAALFVALADLKVAIAGKKMRSATGITTVALRFANQRGLTGWLSL